MFLDVSKAERDAFMSQTAGCLIPGYTGHCPTLKFRFGRCYGAGTQEIIRELANRGVIRAGPYRQYVDNTADLGLAKAPAMTYPYRGDTYPDHRTMPQATKGRYIRGYTGYIPGLHFRYGASYGRSATDSFLEFNTRIDEQKLRRDAERKRFPLGAVRPRTPLAPSIRSRDEMAQALNQYVEENIRYKEKHVSAEYPPIAGYTGHIPRVRSGENSLSQGYHNAAQRALSLLRKDRAKRADAGRKR